MRSRHSSLELIWFRPILDPITAKRGAAAVQAPKINVTLARQKIERQYHMITLQLNTFECFPETSNYQIDKVPRSGPSIDIVTKINLHPAFFGGAIGILEDQPVQIAKQPGATVNVAHRIEPDTLRNPCHDSAAYSS